MQATLRLLLSSALLFFILSAHAQNAELDSLKKIRKPTGIRIGTDLIALGKTVYKSPLTGYELNADVDFGRYYLAFDYGSWSRKDSLRNGYYKNDGRYIRIGIDINFLLKDPDRNMLFIGFRYGQSNFEEQLTYETLANDFGTITTTVNNTNAKGSWGEMTSGLRVKIWKPIWMGFTARMKVFAGSSGSGDMETFEIPGYGKTAKSIYWGFNYQVFYRFPLKKEK